MFYIIYDELLKEKVQNDGRFAFLYQSNKNNKIAYVFCLKDKVEKIDFAVDSLFEFGTKVNPKYQITQVLTF